MFDAKNLLDALLGNASSQTPTKAASEPRGNPSEAQSTGGSGAARGQAGTPGEATESSQLDLASILEKLQGAGGSGGLPEILSQVFSQATSGLREGASQIGEQTGADDALGEAVRRLSGKSPDELLAAIRELVSKNQFGAGAVLGGLGGFLLGSRTGRSAAANAARIGALALIGGLAYKAYQNYQAGRPLIAASKTEIDVTPPPAGSGFEAEAVSNEEARNLIRAMVAAAAADGRVGPDEQEAITGRLKEVGMDEEAEEFLASELNNPASIDEIAAAVKSKEAASLVYTSARLAIDPDTPAERDFLQQLATRLQIEPELAAHIDASARSIESRSLH